MLARTVVAIAALLVVGGCVEPKPDLPVTVTYRESMVGQGYVAQFRNQSDRYLTVVVEFENKTLNDRKRGYIELAAGGTQEIGWMEGWKFTSGETIELSHDDYRPRSYRIP